MKLLMRPGDGVDIIYYPEDVSYILSVLEYYGYQVSYSDVAWAWEQHSNDFAASWLVLDGYSDKNIIEIMLKYLRLVEL